MIITKLSLQKRDEQRVNIFVDEKYALSLTIQQVADLGLKKGAQIDEAELKRLKKESSFGKLYARALAHALSRPHSQREMQDYLRRVGQRRYDDLDHAAYEAIIEKLTRLKYIDDQRFAEFWAEMRQRNKRSARSIAYELRGKGVADDIIKQVVTDDGDAANIARLIEKKRGKYNTEEKLIRYLMSKGFRYDDVRTALAE